MTALLVSVCLSLGLAANAALAGASHHHARPHVRSYTVHAGDTLWSVAVRFGGRQADPRPLVDGIVEANHLVGPIRPGQTLRVPLP